jgi:hypothetical protein
MEARRQLSAWRREPDQRGQQAEPGEQGSALPPSLAPTLLAVGHRFGTLAARPRVAGTSGVALITRRAVQKRQRLVVGPFDDPPDAGRRRLAGEQDEVPGEALQEGGQSIVDPPGRLLGSPVELVVGGGQLGLVAGDDVVE